MYIHLEEQRDKLQMTGILCKAASEANSTIENLLLVR